MTKYDFSLVLAGPEMTEAMADALYAAGCGDATITERDGICTIHFDREAESLEQAIRSALANAQAAGCRVAHVLIEADAESLQV